MRWCDDARARCVAVPLALGLAVCLRAGGVAGERRRPADITVRLVPSKAEYVYGESITLLVELANRCQAARTVALASGLAPDGLDRIELRVNQKDGYRPVGSIVRLHGEAAILDPGETLKLRYSWFHLPIGEHRLTAVYHSAADRTGGQAAEGLWQGTAQSASVTLRVRGGPLPPAAREAYRAYEAAIIRALPQMDISAKVRVLGALQCHMPLCRDVMRALLKDPDPLARATTINALGLIGDKEYCAAARWSHDVSLLPEVLQIGERARHPQVKGAVINALGYARKALDKRQRDTAMAMLTRYLDDRRPDVGGNAAFAMLQIDRHRAAKPLQEKVRREGALDPVFRNLLAQGLVKATGKFGISEGLEALLKEAAERPMPD